MEVERSPFIVRQIHKRVSGVLLLHRPRDSKLAPSFTYFISGFDVSALFNELLDHAGVAPLAGLVQGRPPLGRE